MAPDSPLLALDPQQELTTFWKRNVGTGFLSAVLCVSLRPLRWMAILTAEAQRYAEDRRVISSICGALCEVKEEGSGALIYAAKIKVLEGHTIENAAARSY